MIHQYKLNGYNIVIDVYSGSIHVVDDVAYDIIRLFCEKKESENFSLPEKDDVINEILERAGEGAYPDEDFSDETKAKSEIAECYDDICSLIDREKLFSEDTFRIDEGLPVEAGVGGMNGPRARLLKNKNTDIKALCLHVSHACDLTCAYCFAGQGRFNGPAALMNFDTAKAAIDFLVENSGPHHNLEIDFFGGEPLLNFDVVKKTVAYARSIEKDGGKNFRFTLTTNGMGIDDEVIDFVNRECHNVVLSLDGRKEIHDRERRTGDGTGSYDTIVPKFQRLVAARTGKDCGAVKVSDLPDDLTLGVDTGNTGYYIRGTFTHYNPDFTEDIFHMRDLGFMELSMEPVVTDKDSEFALTEDDLPVLMEQYEILAKEMIETDRPFTFYHFMLDLVHGPCIYKRISGCGSGTEYFAVTPAGEFYPCHQFVGDEKYLMGDIWRGIYEDKKLGQEKSGSEIREDFLETNIYSRKECQDCWAKLHCSGGCAANSYHSSGDILGVYEYGCTLFKKRMECAIMMKIAEQYGENR